MPGTSKLLALLVGTVVGLCAGGVALAVAGRGPIPRPPPAPIPSEPELTPEEWTARWEGEQREAFDALCARVGALPAQRPFDRSGMRPEPPLTAEEELASLRGQLEAAVAEFRKGRTWPCWKHSEELAERLALFAWRFGQDPRATDGWPAVAAAAQHLLADLEREPPALEFEPHDSYAALFRAQLLELAGRSAEADEALAAVKVQHFCGNCSAARQAVVERRRSEAAERRGEFVRALDLLDDFASAPFDFHLVDLADAGTLARYGLLLLHAGRDADGRCMLQLVAELRPGTPGAEVARAALVQLGAYREPTLERLQRVWIDGAADERDPYRRAAVEAIVHLPIDDRFERLAALRLQGEQAALDGLIALRDERARPILESELLQGDLGRAEAVLRGLHELQGPADHYLRPMLERLALRDQSSRLVDTASLDVYLRTLCGDGPTMTTKEMADDVDFSKAWLAWLDEHGR